MTNIKPVPSNDDIRAFAEMLIRVAHALGLTDVRELAGILTMTSDMHVVGVDETFVSPIVSDVHGARGALVARAYLVILDTYFLSDSMHDAIIELIVDGDSIAND